MLSLLLPLLVQVGPAPSQPPVSPLPPEMQDQRNAPPRNRQQQIQPDSAALAECLALARTDPAAAIAYADQRLGTAGGIDVAHLQHCRGVALSAQESFEEAAEAFVAARDAVAADRPAYRARLGALAGNAALAAGDAEGALGAFDAAATDAAGEVSLAGEIALDSARALVGLGNLDEAAEALAAAREALPADPQAWLLSATLSRRTGDLAAAQAQIVRASELDPRNRAVGLEAGVIAVLAGQDEAARKSWQSVVEASPESPEAEIARGYLTQLDGAGSGS